MGKQYRKPRNLKGNIVAVETLYRVAGIEFCSLEEAEKFDRFLVSLPESAYPYQVDDPSWETEMSVSARAVIEILRLAFASKGEAMAIAHPWQVWHTALQNGLVIPPAVQAPAKKRAPKKVRADDHPRDWS